MLSSIPFRAPFFSPEFLSIFGILVLYHALNLQTSTKWGDLLKKFFHIALPLRNSKPISYCTFWYLPFDANLRYHLQISVAEFTRDRKMMSVLCSRNQLQIMFLKGAPESIISRCTSILCNDDGATVPLTASTRAELELRFQRSVSPPYLPE